MYVCLSACLSVRLYAWMCVYIYDRPTTGVYLSTSAKRRLSGIRTPPGHRLGTAWAPPGNHVDTSWAPPGHNLDTTPWQAYSK